MKIRKHSAFTLIELLVVIGIIAVLAGVGMPVYLSARKSGAMTASLQNCKQILIGFKMFANDHSSAYPFYIDPESPTAPLTNSNEAMESLMPRYNKDKKIYDNAASDWCKKTGSSGSTTNQYKVMAGDNDWAYVTG